MENNYPITGKLYLRVTLAAASPVIIGCGEAETSDIDVVRDPVSGAPLVPATSIVGVFRSYLAKTLEKNKHLQQNFIYLFGDAYKKTGKKNTQLQAQSALQCDDIVLTRARIMSRDGVAIDSRTNTAIDKSKYIFELAENNTSFDLNLDITLRAPYDSQIFKDFLFTIFSGIKDGQIRLGARTNKGFGRLALPANAVKLAELDFTRKPDVHQWLTNKLQFNQVDDQVLEKYRQQPKEFKIDAWFRLKNSMLIKSYSGDPGAPDAVPLSCHDSTKYLLPGTSVMGAIKHRAGKILNTLQVTDSEQRLQSLFGFVAVDNDQRARKGRVGVEETIVENVISKIQTRIKIDRFTGGTWHGALFDMMPLWQNSDDAAVHIIITVKDYLEWEPNLLLFILKDLWTGDLAIGGDKNVGRGVLAGVCAEISRDGVPTSLRTDREGRLVGSFVSENVRT